MIDRSSNPRRSGSGAYLQLSVGRDAVGLSRFLDQRREGNGWLALGDGSDVATNEGAIGDLPRQNALHGHVGNVTRNGSAESGAVGTRCVCVISLGQRNKCRSTATARYLPLLAEEIFTVSEQMSRETWGTKCTHCQPPRAARDHQPSYSWLEASPLCFGLYYASGLHDRLSAPAHAY